MASIFGTIIGISSRGVTGMVVVFYAAVINASKQGLQPSCVSK